MVWLDRLDEWLRHVIQSGMMFLGRRFGVRREQVTRFCGWTATFLPAVSVLDNTLGASVAGLVMIVITNGYFALIANIRGLGLLRRNEQWGAYTNWIEWGWLRRLELFLFPVTEMLNVVQIINGDFWQTGAALRPVLFLIMFYSITVNELPPKQKKSQRVTAAARAGAH